jgi:hypothetical protein
MITEVVLFREYAGLLNRSEDFIDRCVGDMEKGLLHVDTVNRWGVTLALYFNSSSPSDQRLWDRYWALGPSVALFWKLALSGPSVALVLDEFTHSSRRLRETSVLWEDLGLVLSFQHMMPAWMRVEACRRIRDCVRFAWMAAVVAA